MVSNIINNCNHNNSDINYNNIQSIRNEKLSTNNFKSNIKLSN